MVPKPKTNRRNNPNNTQIHDRLLSLLGMGTSITSVGFKLPGVHEISRQEGPGYKLFIVLIFL